MIDVWYRRILAGTQKFSDCPTTYRDGVLSLLRRDVSDGKIEQETYEELTGEDYDA